VKYLIVGLGNIGEEYADTRHNIGFTILDAFAEGSNVVFKHKRHAYQAEAKYKARSLILIKPTTYMNLSGKAVNYWLQKTGIQADNMLVLVDDIAIPFGHLRLKPSGGDGGHNGLKSIQDYLHHSNYARLRFGIGNTFHSGQQVDYVLSEWSENERKLIVERLDTCCDLIQSFVTLGLERTMNRFNNNKPLAE